VRTAILNKGDDSSLGLSDLTPALWQQLSEEPKTGTGTPGSAESKAIPVDQAHDAQSCFRGILAENSWNLPRSLDYCEKVLLQCALQSARGNQSRAARLTGLTPRTVYNKLHKHKLNQ
jgi:DNA-binding NtrC family response regulator